MKNFLRVVLLAIVIGQISCIEIPNKFTALPPGPWRGVLKLPLDLGPEAIKTIETKEAQAMRNYRELPFNFNVNYTGKDSFNIEILNGSESIMVSDIQYGIDRATAKDTLVINFPGYDTYIRGIYEENHIEGAWYVNYRESYSIPFIAYQGQDHRFRTSGKGPNIDLNGDWEINFEYNKPEESYPAIGSFVQEEDGRLTGTFKTETGDYRFLEGVVSGEKFYLSVFDGSHAFLFEGKKTGDDEIVGTFSSGKHYKSDWIGKKAKSENYLKDPYDLTQSTSNDPVKFSFKDVDGNMVSLDDPVYNDKIKLINIMGTWCPNCRDEVEFLLKNYDRLVAKDIEIITLSFERYKEEARNAASIKKYQAHMNIPWKMLNCGYYNKAEATERLPFIDKVISYPTLLFLDKNNKIIKVHTGFNGPATAEFAGFEDEFWDIINKL